MKFTLLAKYVRILGVLKNFQPFHSRHLTLNSTSNYKRPRLRPILMCEIVFVIFFFINELYST